MGATQGNLSDLRGIGEIFGTKIFSNSSVLEELLSNGHFPDDVLNTRGIHPLLGMYALLS